MFTHATQTIISVILFFIVFAAATPTPQSSGSCNTGPIQCCQQVQAANAGGPITALLGLLGVVVSPLDALVGVTCTPITVIGAGQSGCNAHPVCCQNNNVGGLLSIGCVPVSL